VWSAHVRSEVPLAALVSYCECAQGVLEEQMRSASALGALVSYWPLAHCVTCLQVPAPFKSWKRPVAHGKQPALPWPAA
jgi:hypothetical protein